MNYLSVCSGIEAASQAFVPRGWNPVAFSEIEPFPSAVLAHHYPETPNWGDMTKFKDWPDADVDVLCGGTPCQSFSVAGLRQGLADPRGNLMLTFGAIADRYRPKWLVWENVPGVLSSNGGRDFGTFLGMLGQLGYGTAYRVLDAQHVRTCRFPHAVPQRRRRVFVVGYLGDWRRAAAVLFDRESLSGHPAPRRQAGQSTARGFECGPQGGSLTDLAPTLDTRCKDGPIRNQLGAGVMVSNSGDVGYCLTASAQGSLDAETETMLAVPPIAGTMKSMANSGGFSNSVDHAAGGYMIPISFRIAGDGNAYEEGSIAAPLTTGTDKSASTIAFVQNTRDEVRLMGGDGQIAGALAAETGAKQQCYLASPWAVRRLTPRECERLQGFPDDFTRIPYRGKPADKCPDGPRYKAIGNSWAVNCADWIAERIDQVDAW